MGYDEEQFERDSETVDMWCVSYTSIGKYFEEWMQRELRGLDSRITTLDAMTPKGELKDELAKMSEVVRRANEKDMPEAFRRLHGIIKDVAKGDSGWEPVASHRELYAAFADVHSLADQLGKFRAKVDDLWIQAKPG